MPSCKFLFIFQTTKGGVILPDQGLGKVLRGTVISAGPGSRDNVSINVSILMCENTKIQDFYTLWQTQICRQHTFMFCTINFFEIDCFDGL